MIDFIIKSTIALCVLLGAYHLLLEKEKFHQFNRFFLLMSLLISFVIPFVTIEIIEKVANIQTNNVVIPGQITAQIIEEKLPIHIVLAWFLYVAVTLFLLFRFIQNLYELIRKTNSAATVKYQNAKLVLLKEKTLPYTFWNTIFINEEDYKNKKIEKELFTHELIHVNQKHSLDILLIEIIKTVFWFNPIFIFYKKAIQLNHEFLADEKVVRSHHNVSFYQNLLLEKANQSPIYYLASNLNYYVTKKRLIMMTTTTSVSRGLFKKTLLLPLLTGLVYLLCTKTVAQETKSKTTTNAEAEKKPVSFKAYYDDTTFKIKDDKGLVVKEKKYSELTLAEKKLIAGDFEGSKFSINEEEINKNQKLGSEMITIETYKTTLNKENDLVKKQDGFKISYDTTSVKEPQFSKGIEEFYKFIGSNFKMPLEASKSKVSGKIMMKFIVEKDGSLSEIKVEKDLGYGLGNEAIRVLKLSPKWNPASKNGEPIRVEYSLPITIQAKE